MTPDLVEAPFSSTFISEFQSAAKRIFGDGTTPDWLGALQWRLERMPDVTVFVARSESRLIGFKAGYATAYDRYYSWLGGVDPDFRRQGIAYRLMHRQHDWLSASRFRSVETHVEQNNHAMIQLNLNSGMIVTGFYLKDGKPYCIMHKNCGAAAAQ